MNPSLRWQSLCYHLSKTECGVKTSKRLSRGGKKNPECVQNPSQQVAVGCIQDAVATGQVLCQCRQRFPEGPFPHPRLPEQLQWWPVGVRGTSGQKEGQGTRAGETGECHPQCNQSSFTPMSYTLGLWENPLRSIPELKQLNIVVNSVLAEKT